MKTLIPANKPVFALALSVLSLSGCLSGCAGSREAARLADITSAHVNTLSSEMQAFVSNANDSRKSDALRLASIRKYYQSIDDLSLSEVRAWRANPADQQSKNKIAAFESLQQDATVDMATTDSSIKQEGNAVSALEASYGQITYSPAQIQVVVANLQSLSKRSTGTARLQAFYVFSDAVLQDAKNGLNASKLNPNGVAKQAHK